MYFKTCKQAIVKLCLETKQNIYNTVNMFNNLTVQTSKRNFKV